MQSLVKLFWDICLLRKGPQDVPAATALFWLLLPVGLIVDLFIAANFVEFQSAILLVVSNSLVLFGVVIGLLLVFPYADRVIQTLSSLIGTGLVFSLIRIPLMFIFKTVPDHAGMFGFIEIFVLIWSLVVIAHILRLALSIEWFLAAMLSFGYFMVSYQLANYFIPQAG